MTLLLALDFLKSREFINSSCDFIKSDVCPVKVRLRAPRNLPRCTANSDTYRQ